MNYQRSLNILYVGFYEIIRHKSERTLQKEHQALYLLSLTSVRNIF